MDVQPYQQNLNTVFGNVTYYIDFYQRDYKWTNEPVNRLLDDIFYKFNQEYENNKSLDPDEEVINTHYSWYYLNTYVTNKVGGRMYVVDGQQRLTTLTLLLIKIYHLAKKNGSALDGWIESKIAGKAGFKHNFWMNHEKHNTPLEQIFKGEFELKEIDVSSGITAVNMVKNYELISRFLGSELSNKHKLETFTFYLLHRLVMVNLSVSQTDVPMIFEVINDRGVKLKPYEILKGKLLGQLDKIELEKGNYNEMWEKQVTIINSYFEDEIDEFFRYFLKAKFTDNRKTGHEFDGDYHRVMFNNHVNKVLKLKHNQLGVKNFLKEKYIYYTNLYAKVLSYYDDLNEAQQWVFYNKLNERDGQFMLILSACEINDKQEALKIKTISYEVDRAFALLQLQNGYDSNAFTEMEYKISNEIREKDPTEYRAVFDKYIANELSNTRMTAVGRPFRYSYFKNIGINLNTRFKRYFFARIDKYLADNMNLNLKHPFSDLVTKTGAKSGFHIEHILSYNEENLSYFEDEEVFERERNRLGGILLLKGRDNISSGNELFSEKLKTYNNTLYWNESLRHDFYKSKKDLHDFMSNEGISFEAYNKFGQEELEARHKLLYELVKRIWK